MNQVSCRLDRHCRRAASPPRETHLPLRLCGFARVTLYTPALLTLTRLKLFSHKGGRVESNGRLSPAPVAPPRQTRGIVLDSVAALVTKQELDGEIGDSTVGAQARLMSAAMRKLTALISKARTVCIFTNQIREKIGVMFGNPETTPGGRALKFFSSLRVDIRRIGQIKATDGTVTGSRTKIKVVKNKVAPPFTEAEFDIMYNEGISSTGSLLDLALEMEIVQKRGSWFSYGGTQLAQGRDAAKELLKGDPVLYADIETKVKDLLESKKKN